jgi:nucleoside-diphosphate kinase
MERTLAIIKPDAVEDRVAGKILARYEQEGFQIVAMKMLHMTKDEAAKFYQVHKQQKFYDDLCEFMSSGPCIPMVLEAPDAIQKNRGLMGATDPAEAEEGTIRKLYARSKQNNAVHGSDGPDTAEEEIKFFFSKLEMVS